jgi:HEAT repeat protein
MLRELALASLALAVAGALVLAVLVVRRGVLAGRERRSAEERLTPIALAVAFEDESERPALSKRDAVVLAGLLGRFSARLRGGSRERIAQHFERHGHIRDEIHALSDRRSWRRATAAYVLGDMGSSAAVPALVEALDDRERDVRSAAARSLGQLGDAEAVEPLLGALSSRRVPRGVVGQAVLALGSAAVPQLRPLLEHAEPGVRATAAELIGLLGGAGEAEPLVDRLTDTSAAVRERAALALGRLGAAEAYEGLERALDDPAPPVRAAAAEALGLVGNTRAFQRLMHIACCDVFEPARAAARALARLAPERLQGAAREPDAGPHVREAAATAALEAGAL